MAEIGETTTSATCTTEAVQIHPSDAISISSTIGGIQRSLSESNAPSDVNRTVNIDALHNVLKIIINQVNGLSNKLSALKDNVKSSFEAVSERDTKFNERLTELYDNCCTFNEAKSWRDGHNDRLLDLESKIDISSTQINAFREENRELKSQWTAQIERMKSHLDLLEQNESRSVSHSTDISDNNDVNNDTNNITDHSHSTNSISRHSDDVLTDSLKGDIDELYDMFYDLDCRVIECEQYPRRENLIISGIPACVQQNELESTVINIVQELGFNIGPRDVSACHRLGRGRNGFPPRVIVRFVNRKIVDFCLSNKKRLSELRGVLRMNIRFFESLCGSNEESLKLCNKLKESGDIHNFFIRNGFLKVVVEEGDNPWRIRHPNVLRNEFSIPEDR